MRSAGRIVVVGDVVTDVLAVLSEPLSAGSDTRAGIGMTGGGQAANTAAWLAAEGAAVTLVAAVGDDAAGTARLAELDAAGVHLAVRRCAGPTGTVIVLAHQSDRTMVADRAANLQLSAADVDAALDGAPAARHLHLSGYTLLDAESRAAGQHALASARARGLTTSVDASSAHPLRRAGATSFLDWIAEVDLLLANDDEATVLAGGTDPGEQARVLTATAQHVVVKRGAAGAVWADRQGRLLAEPAHPVQRVDPTGAGDAFAAGLLAGWLSGAGATAALRRATALGARAVGTVGARPPTGPVTARRR
ncbi:MAG TPA: PfkB family carbohydrate kinase [Micromonosporaceae bacterium]|nr:PfkB family carbohydrate kinase [Micromonosporaceae bacterium]